MDSDSEEIEALKKQITTLKKQISVAAAIGLLFGGGGIFGAYKWLDSDRKLIAVEIRQKSIDVEVAKSKALNEHYIEQIAALEKSINQGHMTSDEVEKAKIEINKLKNDKIKTMLDQIEAIETRQFLDPLQHGEISRNAYKYKYA